MKRVSHFLLGSLIWTWLCLVCFETYGFFSGEARAQAVVPVPTLCFNASEGRTFLDSHGPVTAQGLFSDQLIVELRVKPDGQYIIAVINTKGTVCVTAIGTDWSASKEQPI